MKDYEHSLKYLNSITTDKMEHLFLSKDFWKWLSKSDMVEKIELADKVRKYKIKQEIADMGADFYIKYNDGISFGYNSTHKGILESLSMGKKENEKKIDRDVREDINHPERYGGDTTYECVKVLKAWMTPEEYRGFLRGNAIKYICRLGKKDEAVKELQKAQWYINKLIEEFGN